jgi:hypothetical protein
MANVTKASLKGEAYLAKNPGATAEQVAKHCGLSVSGVQKSVWWKKRKQPTQGASNA